MSLLDVLHHQKKRQKYFENKIKVAFLLTYTVNRKDTEENNHHAKKVRDSLSKLDTLNIGWFSQKPLETTFRGHLAIEATEWDDKKENNRKKEIKEHVKKIVFDAIREKLSKDLDTKKAKISMMIMVNGVSEPFEISFDG